MKMFRKFKISFFIGMMFLVVFIPGKIFGENGIDELLKFPFERLLIGEESIKPDEIEYTPVPPLYLNINDFSVELTKIKFIFYEDESGTLRCKIVSQAVIKLMNKTIQFTLNIFPDGSFRGEFSEENISFISPVPVNTFLTTIKNMNLSEDGLFIDGNIKIIPTFSVDFTSLGVDNNFNISKGEIVISESFVVEKDFGKIHVTRAILNQNGLCAQGKIIATLPVIGDVEEEFENVCFDKDFKIAPGGKEFNIKGGIASIGEGGFIVRPVLLIPDTLQIGSFTLTNVMCSYIDGKVSGSAKVRLYDNEWLVLFRNVEISGNSITSGEVIFTVFFSQDDFPPASPIRCYPDDDHPLYCDIDFLEKYREGEVLNDLIKFSIGSFSFALSRIVFTPISASSSGVVSIPNIGDIEFDDVVITRDGIKSANILWETVPPLSIDLGILTIGFKKANIVVNDGDVIANVESIIHGIPTMEDFVLETSLSIDKNGKISGSVKHLCENDVDCKKILDTIKVKLLEIVISNSSISNVSLQGEIANLPLFNECVEHNPIPVNAIFGNDKIYLTVDWLPQDITKCSFDIAEAKIKLTQVLLDIIINLNEGIEKGIFELAAAIDGEIKPLNNVSLKVEKIKFKLEVENE